MSRCMLIQGGHSRRKGSALALAIAGVAATVAVKVALHGTAFSQPRSPALHGQQQRRSAAVALRARGGDDDDYEFGGMMLETKYLMPGQELDGVITRFGVNRQEVQFGVFVDVGAEREGLVPMSKLSSARVDTIADAGLKEGQQVTVWVVSVTEDRFTLSLARSKTLPMADVSEFKQVAGTEQWLDGYVARVVDFGAFVALRPPSGEISEAQGLCHVSQIVNPDGSRVDKVADVVSAGQEVKVRVMSIDPEGRKMSLTMREPEKSNEEKYSPFTSIPSDQWISGIVTRFANFGAFVEVTSPSGAKAEALLHVSEIKDGFVEDPAEELELDQEIQVRVLKVELEDGKMSLSRREPKSEGAGADAAPESEEDAGEERVR